MEYGTRVCPTLFFIPQASSRVKIVLDNVCFTYKFYFPDLIRFKATQSHGASRQPMTGVLSNLQCSPTLHLSTISRYFTLDHLWKYNSTFGVTDADFRLEP